MNLNVSIPDELLDDYEKTLGTHAVYLHNIEEAAEFIHALTKFLRGKPLAGVAVIEETADLLICVMHLIRLLGMEDDVPAMIAKKQGKAIREIMATKGG